MEIHRSRVEVHCTLWLCVMHDSLRMLLKTYVTDNFCNKFHLLPRYDQVITTRGKETLTALWVGSGLTYWNKQCPCALPCRIWVSRGNLSTKIPVYSSYVLLVCKCIRLCNTGTTWGLNFQWMNFLQFWVNDIKSGSRKNFWNCTLMIVTRLKWYANLTTISCLQGNR